MDSNISKMEEFRSNLLLLLQCGHPEGLPINQLKSEYKQYFNEDVGPEVILPKNFKNNKHWDALFQLKEFKDDFALFFMGTAVYVKAVRPRNFAEMKLIAQLAKHSHLTLAKKAEFQCTCCPHDLWTTLSKEAAVEPIILANNINNNLSQQQTQTVIEIPSSRHPEDIVVKIEPHQMIMSNGPDEDSSSSRGTHSGNDSSGLYSLVQQQQQATAHGNHVHQNSNYVNGGLTTVISHDLSGSGSSNMSSNTNDGFMLDHQLRVQEHASPQVAQGLQAFASLLNSNSTGSGNIGQATATANPDGSVSQPFYTFVLQNGEIKVMQIVSSVPDGQATNGEVVTSPPLPVVNPAPNVSPQIGRKSLPPPKRNDSGSQITEITNFLCSMPGCGQNFDIKQHLQNHERTCSLKKYPCTFPDCDRRFKNSKQRHAHMTSRHKGLENAFRCSVPDCTAFFKTADRLQVHTLRCRFKYEQFQLMDDEEAALNNLNNLNNNNGIATPSSNQELQSVPSLNSSTEESNETSVPTAESSNAATSIQSTSPSGNKVSNSGVQHKKIKLEGAAKGNAGLSTVDLSLVKSEIME